MSHSSSMRSLRSIANIISNSKIVHPSHAFRFAGTVRMLHINTENSILLRHDDHTTGITMLTLNKPEKYNVLSWEMLDALQKVLDMIACQESIKVLIIGASGKAFCSGHDLRDIKSNTRDLFTKCSQTMISINNLPQPVIAMVNGVATAAGCQLVASCDLAVASENAKFGTSGINLGLFCSTPAVALSRNIHRKHAMQMLLTGNLITAQEAFSYGLINKVVPPNKLYSETIKLATKIAAKSQYAVRLGKDMFYKQMRYNDLSDAYEFATEEIVCNMKHEDARRGIDEFLSKSKEKPS